MPLLFIQCGKIVIQLSKISRFEFPPLQLNRNKSPERTMIKKQINKRLLISNNQTVLISDEAKIRSQCLNKFANFRHKGPLQ